MSYSYTSRFKIPVPTGGDTSWLNYLTHWANLNDVMFDALSRNNYTVSGLSVNTSSGSLEFSYAAGVVSIGNSTVNISAGNGVNTANAFNWLYVQNGQMKRSTTPPTGSSVAPVACMHTGATGVVGYANLNLSPPIVNNATITPYQVNPISNINMATGKRVLHTDSNVGSNIVMFGNAQTQTVLNWGNQKTAKDWTTVDVSDKVPIGTKFAILNCYVTTYFYESVKGWAVLEVKTSSDHDNYVYNIVDYGHPDAYILNPIPRGKVNQIMLPLSDRTFQARSLISASGVGVGGYYANIKLVGYVI